MWEYGLVKVTSASVNNWTRLNLVSLTIIKRAQDASQQTLFLSTCYHIHQHSFSFKFNLETKRDAAVLEFMIGKLYLTSFPLLLLAE